MRRLQHLQRKQAPLTSSLLDGALQHNCALIQAILLDDLAIMEHVKLLRRIFAGKHHNGFFAAGMFTLQQLWRNSMPNSDHITDDG